MADPLSTPKKIFDLQGESQIAVNGSSRQEGNDRNIRLLTLICVMVPLAAVAFYKLAALVASACWACG